MRRGAIASSSLAASVWLASWRRAVSIFVPIAVVWLWWFTYMAQQNAWHLFTDVNAEEAAAAAAAAAVVHNTSTANATAFSPRVARTGAAGGFPFFALSITMVFGSFIAGATSEGGAAVAFPVMTLILGIQPLIARDFGLMIQSVGMVAASFTIVILRVTISYRAVAFVSLGGMLGSALAIEVLFARISPPYLKLWFCCIWMSFAISLWLLNRHVSRPTFDGLPGYTNTDDSTSGGSGSARGSGNGNGIDDAPRMTTAVLLLAGVIGGCLSGLTGSGIDMASFSVLTLLFRVSEKVATPTSVVIMGISSVFGFFFRGVVSSEGLSDAAWSYWLVCVPIVVVGAPFGAFVGRTLHRLTLARAVYAADTLQLAGALFVIRPWLPRVDGGKVDDPTALCVSSLSILVVFGLLFRYMSMRGLESLKQRVRIEHPASPAQADVQEYRADEDLELIVIL
jgi:uncharacterized membrane protein YfcA